MNKQKIIVSIDIVNQNRSVGYLYPQFIRDRESATFEYDNSWLEDSLSFAIDPYLPLIDGKHHTPSGFKNSLAVLKMLALILGVEI